MACVSGLPAGQCTTKNAVYQIIRKECEHFYIGETVRELAQHVAEQMRDAKSCPQIHPGESLSTSAC